ncbi:MAG TPA: hypothetical protein VGH89_37970 [Pseudonocardia sp.]
MSSSRVAARPSPIDVLVGVMIDDQYRERMHFTGTDSMEVDLLCRVMC